MSHEPTDLELLIEKSRKVLEIPEISRDNNGSSLLNDDDEERPNNDHNYKNITPFDKILTADGTNSDSSSSIADDDDDDDDGSYRSLLSSSSSHENNDPQCIDSGQQYDPHSPSKKTGSTLSAAIFGIFKGMVGPAILYLPRGFADAGYAIALGLLCLTTMMFLYSSHCLLTCWHEQMAVLENNNRRASYDDDDDDDGSPRRRRQQQRRRKGLSYPSLARLAFGEWGEWLVMNGIALMQLGVCLTYFIFVPQNLRTSVDELLGVQLPFWAYLAGMVMIQIPLSWVRDIRTLTYTNVLANALILFGLVTCLYFAITTTTPTTLLLSNITHLPPIGSHYFPFIGTAVLLFEGSITLCIPLQDAVDGDRPRKLYPMVYHRTIGSIVLFYSIFGIVCWAAFGDEVHTVLTTSLPETVLATGVQLSYSLAVIFTFPLQAYPAHEILVRLVLHNPTIETNKSLSSGGGTGWKRPILTSLVVVLLSTVALMEMDRLGHVVSLMGSLLGCPIAFVFPPLIYDTLSGGHLPGWKRFLNGTVAILGIVGMAASSFSTLMTWNSAEGGDVR